MNIELERLARGIFNWQSGAAYAVVDRETLNIYFDCGTSFGESFTEKQWHRARQDLGLIMTDEEEEAMGNDNGWINWAGGDCPVHENCNVLYQMRDGDRCEERAGKLDWKDNGKHYDIVSYKIQMRVYAEADDYRQKQPPVQVVSRSDGSTASYYELPAGCTELQHLISHRNLNAQDGEMFRAIYRKGMASHSDELRDAKKVLFYAQAEVDRLEALK